MSLSVEKRFSAENIDVKMIAAVFDISIQKTYEIFLPVFLTQRLRRHGKRIGNTVARIFVRQFRNRFQRCERAVRIPSVHGIGSGSKGLSRPSSVRGITRILAVYDVARNSENRRRGNAFAVSVVAFNLVHKRFKQPHRKLVRPVVVVTVFGIVADNFKIGNYSLFVPDGINFGVLYSRKRVSRAR